MIAAQGGENDAPLPVAKERMEIKNEKTSL